MKGNRGVDHLHIGLVWTWTGKQGQQGLGLMLGKNMTGFQYTPGAVWSMCTVIPCKKRQTGTGSQGEPGQKRKQSTNQQQ